MREPVPRTGSAARPPGASPDRPLEGPGARGLRDGGFLEVGAAPEVDNDVPRFLRGCRHRCLAGAFLHFEQDVAHPVFIGKQLLVVRGVEQVLHVLLADGDAAVHHVALQALDEHLPADVFPELPGAHAVFDERLPELLHRHLVLLRESEHGPGKGLVVDLHAPARRLLHLDVLQYQPLHELVQQHVTGRRFHALARDLVLYRLQAAQQFGGEYHVFIDDGDDGVEFLVLGCGVAAQRHGNRKHYCPPACAIGRFPPPGESRSGM